MAKDICPSDGYNCLLSAVRNKDSPRIVKSLLARGARVNSINNYRMNSISPLHEAVKHRNMEIVAMLLQAGADVTVKYGPGLTPLYVAVSLGQHEIVNLLLSYKASAHVRDTSSGLTPLHLASIQKEHEIAELLINKNANINEKCSKGMTALHFAVKSKNWEHILLNSHYTNREPDSSEIVRTLLKGGASVSEKNNVGETVLHIAVESGNSKSVKLLLTHGVSVDECDCKGKTPLHIAAEKGYLDITGDLLNYGATITAKTDDGWSPLDLAVKCRNSEITQLFLGKGAQINGEKITLLDAVECGVPKLLVDLLRLSPDKTNEANKKAFLRALRGNNPEIAQLLINHGFTVAYEDANDDELFSNAIKYGYFSLFDDLISYRTAISEATSRAMPDSSLYNVTIRKQDGVVNLFMTNSLAINTDDDEFKADMSYLANSGDFRLIGTLLAKNYICQENSSKDIVNLAAKYMCHDIFKIVWRKGRDFMSNQYVLFLYGMADLLEISDDTIQSDIVDLNFSKASDSTSRKATNGKLSLRYLLEELFISSVPDSVQIYLFSLHSAIENGCTKLLKCVLQQTGVDVNITSKEGATPLHFACKKSIPEVVTLLIDRGAFVNCATNFGVTPLHLASERDADTEIVDILIKSGADTDSTSESGKTPLHLAAKSGSLQNLQLLIKSGAYINSRDKIYGFTPLQEAYKYNNPNVVESLLMVGADCSISDFERSASQIGFNSSLMEDWVRDILFMHVKKMDAVKLYDRSKLEDFVIEFGADYVDELSRMKATAIGFSNFTYLDFVQKAPNQSFAFLMNEIIRKTLRLGSYTEEFPKFATIISGHFYKCIRRMKLVKNIHEQCDPIFCGLTYDCIEHILGFLDEQDLRMLSKVGNGYVLAV